LLPRLVSHLHGASRGRVGRRPCLSVIEGTAEEGVADSMDHGVDGT
jgi:hypothetical protein